MKYISCDLETTGLNPEKCQILEFAAILENTKMNREIKNLPRFHAYIRHESYYFEPMALKMNWELVKAIVFGEVESIPVDVLAFRYTQWLDEQGIDRASMSYAGKNFGGFDSQFLKRVPGWTANVKMKHRCFDVGSRLWTINDEEIPNLSECAKRVGLTGDIAHRAIDDAETVIAIMRATYAREGGQVLSDPDAG